MISDLYKADLTRSSKSTIRGRPRDYDVPPVTETGGQIDYGTTDTDISIIKITPESTVATNAANRFTDRSTIIIKGSTTSISSQNIRYNRNFRWQTRRITRAKR